MPGMRLLFTFELSASVESSDDSTLSDLPFFEEGLTSLAPGTKIGCYLDTLDNLLPLIKEGKIASDITVTVRYKDLNLKSDAIRDNTAKQGT